MKLLELEIHNFRGIRNLSIKPQGENFLIYGPNGSGKSAVVDALDFLLTGQISRMKGKGTKDINLKKHGPHIDYSAKDSWIKANVKIHGLVESIEIKRSLDNPNKLVCEESIRDKIQPVIELASRGQHVLTRREILNYVTADSGTRGKQIQTLLKITDVEKTRNILVKVKNTLKNDYLGAKSSLNTISATIYSNIGIENFDEDKILDFINLNRKVLGGTPLKEINSNKLKDDIEPQILPSDKRINIQLLKTDSDKLQYIKSDNNRESIRNIDLELRELTSKISSDHDLEDALDHLKLTRLGLELLDPDGNCPLCDTPWETRNLKDYLENRIKVLKNAAENLDKITSLTDELILKVNHTIGTLNEIIKSTEILELKEEHELLNIWINDLKQFIRILEHDNYPDTRFNKSMVETLLAPSNLQVVLDNIYSSAKENFHEPSERANSLG